MFLKKQLANFYAIWRILRLLGLQQADVSTSGDLYFLFSVDKYHIGEKHIAAESI
jgi:hypothetical protein